MNIYSPYTYRIAWTSINKHYYGVRYAKGCHPSDFWVKYFTSSKEVKKYRELYGEPDIIEIRKTFNSAELARLWEFKVLKRLNAVKSEMWLNASVGGKEFYCESGENHPNYGKVHSEETKLKMGKNNYSKTAQGREEIRIRQTGSSNSFFGKQHSAESKQKKRDALLGTKRSEEFKEAHRGDRNVSKRLDVRAKLSISGTNTRANDPIIPCPYCNRVIKGKGNLKSHTNKCSIKFELLG